MQKGVNHEELDSGLHSGSAAAEITMNGIINIEGGFFNAGVVITDNRVTLVAPIINYMLGWTVEQVLEYAAKRKWQCSLLRETTQ